MIQNRSLSNLNFSFCSASHAVSPLFTRENVSPFVYAGFRSRLAIGIDRWEARVDWPRMETRSIPRGTWWHPNRDALHKFLSTRPAFLYLYIWDTNRGPSGLLARTAVCRHVTPGKTISGESTARRRFRYVIAQRLPRPRQWTRPPVDTLTLSCPRFH